MKDDKLKAGMAVVKDASCRDGYRAWTIHDNDVDAIWVNVKGDVHEAWDQGKVWLEVKGFVADQVNSDLLVYLEYYSGNFTLNAKEFGYDIHSYYQEYSNKYIGIISLEDIIEVKENQVSTGNKTTFVTIKLNELKKIREHDRR